MQLMLLDLLVLLLATTAKTYDDVALGDDSQALLAFKVGLNDTRGELSSWNEDDDSSCHWKGVTCNPRNSRVIGLNLTGFCLSGRIGKRLSNLQFLQNLSLSNNNLTGPINTSLPGSLRLIDLSGNQLSGSIPESVFQHCGLLRDVSFARNHLSGWIPRSLGSCSELQRVNLSSNKLSGSLQSSVIRNLTKLRALDLSNNFLDGEIPEGIGRLLLLRTVDLSKNNFSGQLPQNIGDCSLIKSVNLGNNFISGGLPRSMRRLSRSCVSLKLGRNLLTGTVPSWIEEMKILSILDLSANRFSGHIPDSLGNLPSLKELKLSMNWFTGMLPESLKNCASLLVFNVSGNSLTGDIAVATSYNGLRVLDLSSNAFSGAIPLEIGDLKSLLFMNLSSNLLVGSIPASIGQLNAITVVDISHNRLTGSIPRQIGGATSLRELRLNNNSLTGSIPAQFGSCSSLTVLILSHNNLTGLIPPAFATLVHLRNVDLSFNYLSGCLPVGLSNLSQLEVFNISYNQFEGPLPPGGFFNRNLSSSIMGNRLLCGSAVDHSCPLVNPKPIVLNPNSSTNISPGNPYPPRHKRIILSISALIAIGAAALIAVGVAAVTVLNFHARSALSRAAATPVSLSGGDDLSPSPAADANYGKLYMFSGDADFAAGTHALLNKDCELGRGGFGAVYRSTLRDGRSVAIKKLTVSSLVKTQEDFEREVRLLGKVRQQNLVTLEGYYWTSSLQLLISEYVSNGSLYKHLHEEAGGNCVSWRQRFKIVLGMAKGLAHLHQLNIIHYNLKSTNVLIDSRGEPKVGDYGLAKLLPMLDHYVLSSKVQSALGYMAPEFACRTVKITDKCDVYSFGILVLEVVTGKKPVEYMEDDVVVLCDMVRGSLEGGRVEECVDGGLCGNFPADEAIPLIKLGLICASQVPSNRPDMGEVVNILELIQCPSEGQEEEVVV